MSGMGKHFGYEQKHEKPKSQIVVTSLPLPIIITTSQPSSHSIVFSFSLPCQRIAVVALMFWLVVEGRKKEEEIVDAQSTIFSTR